MASWVGGGLRTAKNHQHHHRNALGRLSHQTGPSAVAPRDQRTNGGRGRRVGAPVWLKRRRRETNRRSLPSPSARASPSFLPTPRSDSQHTPCNVIPCNHDTSCPFSRGAPPRRPSPDIGSSPRVRVAETLGERGAHLRPPRALTMGPAPPRRARPHKKNNLPPMTSFTPGTRNPFRRESYSLGIDPAIFHSVSAPVDPASIPIPEETEDADHIFELDGAAASPEPGVSGTSSSGGAALLKNGSCSESSELGSIASFESAAEFPEGCLLGFSECAEVLTPLALQVEGNIPDWVSGVFYRCGPGKFEVETELPSSEGDGRVVAIDHWFDGFSLLHRFEVRGGQVFYRNRFTSETQESVMKTTGALPLSFAQSQDPCKSMFKKFFTISLAIPTEFNVNVSVTPGFPVRYPRPGTDDTGNGEWRQILLAKTDANILQELDAETLQPRGYTAYTKMNPKFVGIMTSAHEHYDTTTGEYINFLQDPGPVISTHVFTVNAAHPKGGEVVCTLRTRRASYMHSFAVTQRYIILICCPYYWSMGGIPIVFTHTVASALEWHEHVPVYMYVIDRASKRHVATYQADPFFVFHTINAYDVVYKRTSATADAADAAAADGGAEPVDEDIDIVIDLCAYRSPSNIQEMYLDKFRSGTTDFEASHLRRYTLRGVRTVASRSALGASTYRWWQAMAGWMWPSGDPAVAASATPGPGGSGYPRATYDIRSGPGPELPVIHPDYFRRADYQFAFCVVASARMPFEALVKINVRTRAAVEWRVPGCYPSEPVVVPRPREAGGTGAEDDAVVLSVVLDGNARQTFLLVLDARTFKEIGRASMNTGRVVPFGFHGVYAPMPYDPLAQGKPTVIKTAEMDESEEVTHSVQRKHMDATPPTPPLGGFPKADNVRCELSDVTAELLHELDTTLVPSVLQTYWTTEVHDPRAAPSTTAGKFTLEIGEAAVAELPCYLVMATLSLRQRSQSGLEPAAPRRSVQVVAHVSCHLDTLLETRITTVGKTRTTRKVWAVDQPAPGSAGSTAARHRPASANQEEDQLQAMLARRPELCEMLADFVRSLLVKKPDDVYAFARDYFALGGHE
uniref:Putative carotenoid dioxygenase n=1 Tax=Blastocladiella emersonii TaxID=4808 RepID=A0A060GW07_BLAEM|nr:putative carotenoid dioxygenase [Blastocladiella emersonii]